MIEFHDNLYIFVIDTNQHAGNFEQELCAYVTGIVSEHRGIGEVQAQLYKDEEGAVLEEHNTHIIQLPDKRCCYKPVTIWSTPGWFNDGMGNCYREGSVSNQAAQEQYEKSWEKFSKKKRIHKSFTKFDAYLSVAIFMRKRPTGKQINQMARRANRFACLYREKFNISIEGFRLLKRSTSENLLNEWDRTGRSCSEKPDAGAQGSTGRVQA